MADRRRRSTLVTLVVAALVVAALGVVSPALAAADGPTGSISGTITIAGGADPSGVQVQAYLRSNHGYGGITLTGADGSYTVGGLPDGDYVVEVNSSNRNLVLQYWPGTEDYGSAQTVAVRAGAAVAGIGVQMYPGAILSGTIRTTSDCDLSYVLVSAGAADGKVRSNVQVLADGRWTATGRPAASNYHLVFDGRYAGLADVVHWPSGPRIQDSYFAVEAGSTRTGLDVTLTGPTHGCIAPRPYVEQLYRDLLGRQGTFMEVNGWVQDLVWRSTRETVAAAITSSDEFRLGMIEDAYSWYLDRRSDAGGRAFWLAKMAGGWRIEDIDSGFISSDEYYASLGSTPAGWVRGLYENVLLREPEPWEVQWWVTRLEAGASRADVARGFLFSTEHLSSVVDGYYRELLDRGLDPTGQAMWVRGIQSGHRDEEIIAGIVTSPEYISRVPR